MSIIVKNIKITEIKFDNKSYKNFDKMVEYVKMIKPDYKLYLPKKSKSVLSFELTNTVTDFANCIRRFLMDEILVDSMNVDVEDISTNDKFILNDHLKKCLELIPFQQQLKNKNIKMSLDVKNLTDDIMTIYARHIKITDNNGKELDSEIYFSGNIPIIELRSDKFLSIKLERVT